MSTAILDKFNISAKDRESLLKRFETPASDNTAGNKIIDKIIDGYGLAPVLAALYSQQLAGGFILSSPGNHVFKERDVEDPETGFKFLVQWNPERETRKDHAALVKKGIIKSDIDSSGLVNKDRSGKGCYLCYENIKLQNPGEILLPLELGGASWFAGANFASLGESHFTVMLKEHKPQRYSLQVVKAMLELVFQTGGYCRAIFNSLAGSSILCHLHFQIIASSMPAENITLIKKNELVKVDGVSVFYPDYYLPLIVLRGNNCDALARTADRVLSFWHNSGGETATENIVAFWSGEEYKVLLFLRDMTLLTAPPKLGALAGFEASGLFAFSRGDTERELYEKAAAKALGEMLEQIAPGTMFDSEGLRAYLNI